MRDGGGELAESREARHAGELRPGNLQGIVFRPHALLGVPQFRDVLYDAELANGAAGLVPRDVALAVHHAHRAVRSHDPVFDVVARPAGEGDIARRGGPLAVLRMDEAYPAPVPMWQIDGLHAENPGSLVG